MTPRARFQELEAAAKNGASVEGKVVAIARGGYEVDLGGITGLCPFNQIDVQRLGDQLVHLRQTYAFAVTLARAKGKRVVLSRRRILEREMRKVEREARRKVKAGDVHEGVVASLTDFGAFIDFQGVQGMVHVSELTHQRIERPADFLQIGATVKIKVIKNERRRISLSMRALQPDPWTLVARSFKPGEVIKGKLVRLTEFGVFVEVAPGVDGLLHLSEIPESELEAFKAKVAGKEEVPILVLKIEGVKKRIALGLPPPGAEPGQKVKIPSLRNGDVVDGVVQSVDRSGVLVRLGPGQSGMIPPAETGTPRDTDLTKVFPAGRSLKVLVMGTDRGEGGRRVRLSLRRAERKEERQQLDAYRRSAASGSGSFATLGDFFRKD